MPFCVVLSPVMCFLLCYLVLLLERISTSASSEAIEQLKRTRLLLFVFLEAEVEEGGGAGLWMRFFDKCAIMIGDSLGEQFSLRSCVVSC